MTNTQQSANKPPTIETTNDKESCCGGPAPAGTDACCVEDAAAKIAGASGCGCGAKPRTAQRCC